MCVIVIGHLESQQTSSADTGQALHNTLLKACCGASTLIHPRFTPQAPLPTSAERKLLKERRRLEQLSDYYLTSGTSKLEEQTYPYDSTAWPVSRRQLSRGMLLVCCWFHYMQLFCHDL
jgi:hypothetical protein